MLVGIAAGLMRQALPAHPESAAARERLGTRLEEDWLDWVNREHRGVLPDGVPGSVADLQYETPRWKRVIVPVLQTECHVECVGTNVGALKLFSVDVGPDAWLRLLLFDWVCFRSFLQGQRQRQQQCK